MHRLRFGLLAAFATMLIVIGIAGWLRAELDLHREEQALLAGFAEAGCQAQIVSREFAFAEIPQPGQERRAWYAPEWLSRVTDVTIAGDPPESLLRRAAALPKLRSLRVYTPSSGTMRSAPEILEGLPTFPPSPELLGRPLPEFREPSIQGSTFDRPLPKGEEIDGEDRAAILSSIREGWKPREPRNGVAGDPWLPGRFIKRIETIVARNPWAKKVDLVRDGKFYWSVQRSGVPDFIENQLLTLRNAEGEYGLKFQHEGWRFCQRADAEIDSSIQYTALKSSWNHLPRPDGFEFSYPTFPDVAILDHVARISRIDGRRVRLDIEPFDVDATSDPAFPQSFEVTEMTLVLHEDMDWAVGSERSSVTTVSGKRRTPQLDYVVERTFERRDGYVLPIEEVQGSPIFDQTSPGVFGPAIGPAGLPKFEPIRTRFAWELEPDLDPAIFDPNRYLAEPLPPRKTPSPWYLIPLAVGGGIVIFLIVRGLYRRLRPSRDLEAREPAESVF